MKEASSQITPEEITEVKSLKLLTLNIEGSKHLDKILAFLAKIRPDAVLVQEVFEGDLQSFSNVLGSPSYFSPLCSLSLSGLKADLDNWGIAIFTRGSLINFSENYYKGNKDIAALPNLDNHPADARSLLQVVVERGHERFSLATTHFTWVKGLEVSDEQQEDFRRMLLIIDQSETIQKDGLVLGGDFNSPRGSKLFDTLVDRFKDNVPSDVVTTLDRTPDRPNPFQAVIDGLFTSSHYTASDVEVIGGLSDHRGIVAQIKRVSSLHQTPGWTLEK